MIILYFGEKKDDDEFFAKSDFNEQVTAKNVICLRVAKPADTKAPEAAIVPKARLDAADLWAAYGVKEADTFVVADKYGNPFYTAKEPLLNEKLGEVASHFRTLRKQLRKEVEAAQAAKDKGEVTAALAALKSGFKLGLTGYSEAESATKLYGELMDAGRKSLKDAGKDAAKLDALAKQYAGTDLEAEIAAARKVAN